MRQAGHIATLVDVKGRLRERFFGAILVAIFDVNYRRFPLRFPAV